MTQLTINRSGSPVITINIDDNTMFSRALMGEHKITSDILVRLEVFDEN